MRGRALATQNTTAQPVHELDADTAEAQYALENTECADELAAAVARRNSAQHRPGALSITMAKLHQQLACIHLPAAGVASP